MSTLRTRLISAATCALLVAATCPSQREAGEESNAPKVAQKAKSTHPLTNQKLGIQFAELSSKIRRSIISTKTPYGFAVRSVTKGSLADKAGIKKGTILLEVDGKPLKQVAQLEAVLKNAKPGQKITCKCSERTKRRRFGRSPWTQRDIKLVLPKAKGNAKKKRKSV